MLPEGYSPEISNPPKLDSRSAGISIGTVNRRSHRYWLHVLLLLLTLLSTTAIGARLAENFRINRPPVYLAEDLAAYRSLLSNPSSWVNGLAFSLTLLAILLAHEMGHFIACRRYGLDASLPYFMPFPSIIGTLGAFIRIRSPIYSRLVLFDVGIAGPLAGFALTLPAAVAGIGMSRVVPGIAGMGDLQFGTPALFWFLQNIFFPGVSSADLSLHPVARAAWVGVFATALNLLPIGQLDGGHILYAFFADRHRPLSMLFTLALVPMGLLYWPWLLWAAILFFFGMRHPVIYDATAPGKNRKWLGVAALAIFLLCFMLAPIETSGGQ